MARQAVGTLRGSMRAPVATIVVGTQVAALSAAAVLVLACAEPASDARTAWLHASLIDDHRLLLERDADAVAGKFALMAADPYDFLRGNNGIWGRDITSPGRIELPPFVLDTTVVLVGDPHPENLGTIPSPDGVLVVAYNDFDSSRPGPPELDLRRLALGLHVLVRELEPESGEVLGAEAADAAVIAAVEGYIDAIERARSGEATDADRAPRFGAAGVVLDDLLRRALRDGSAREELELFTQVGDDGLRRLLRGQLEAVEVPGAVDDLVGLSEAESAFVSALVVDWRRRAAEPPGPVLDIARKRGSGIGSYPLWRYWVLFDGPSSSPADDRIVEFKEALDPLPLPGTLGVRWRGHRNAGARIAAHRRTLQPSNGDPFASWAALGDHAFVTREITRYQRGISAGRVRREMLSGDFGLPDLIEFSGRAGALLASAHLRSVDVPEIDVERHRDALVANTLEAIRTYRTTFDEDIARLRALIEQHGPTLGYERSESAWPGEPR